MTGIFQERPHGQSERLPGRDQQSANIFSYTHFILVHLLVGHLFLEEKWKLSAKSSSSSRTARKQ